MQLTKLDDIVKEAAQFAWPTNFDSAHLECLQWPESVVGEMYSELRATGLLPPPSPISLKSDARAEWLRALGNEMFVCRKDDEEALRLYTQAVGAARLDGQEIALAYGNRSAVTFALREYRHSIKDIGRALAGHYPTHLRYKLYERRGKCLMSLSQYRKAAEDFKDVKTHLLKSKLSQSRMTSVISEVDRLLGDCEGKSNVVLEMEVPGFCLIGGLSPYIECASAAVDIQFSADMGRCVVAAKDIRPGEVLAIERPYASVLLPGCYILFCERCKRRCHSSVPCSTCVEVVYCDEECRRAAWSSHHSVECHLLPSLLAIGCDKMDLLALRVLLVSTNCGASLSRLVKSYFVEAATIRRPDEQRGFVDGRYMSSDYHSTHELETNRSHRSGEDLFRRVVIAAVIVHLLKETSDLFSREIGESRVELCLLHAAAGELILRHLMSAPCNAHEIAEMGVWPCGEEMTSESTGVGAAIYPFHSLINHSCDPNVVRHSYSGEDVVLSAIQPIRRGEQLFDNYGYHHAVHDLAARRHHLESQYYFTCQCVACLEDWPLYGDLPEGMPVLATPTSDDAAKLQRTIIDSTGKFLVILSKIKRGTAKIEDFRFLCKHLSLLSNVKRPWKAYNQCQEAIKQCLSFRANHYVHQSN